MKKKKQKESIVYESMRQKIHAQYKAQIDELKNENLELRKFVTDNDQLNHKLVKLEMENNQLKDQIKEITSVDWSKLSLSDRKIIIDSVTMLSRIVNI